MSGGVVAKEEMGILRIYPPITHLGLKWVHASVARKQMVLMLKVRELAILQTKSLIVRC